MQISNTPNYPPDPRAGTEILNSPSFTPLETMTETDNKKPITAVLKSLRIGDSALFPIERRTSVYAVASRLRKELVKLSWNFKLVDDTQNFTVTVVRTS